MHLVIPKKELFSRSASTPSASVILKTKYSAKLSRKEVSAIAHMIATAVPELKVDNVTIIDDQGTPLKISSDGDDFLMSQSAIEYKNSIEKKIVSSVEEMLSSYVGYGRVKVHAAVDIDLDHEVINSEIFDQDKQAVRSRRVAEESEEDGDKSDSNVSVQNNIPGAGGRQTVSGTSRSRGKSDEVINYEISKTITNKVREYGQIKKLSVAMLVDGKYIIGQDGKKQYQERSEEELSKIKSLASSAVGISEGRGDKIEVLNLQFIDLANMDEEPFSITDFLKRDARGLMQIIVIGIVSVLIISMVIKPVIFKFTNKPELHLSF